MQMLWPILVVIGSNIMYNISAKQTPDNINTFFSLGITYAIAMVISFVMFFVTAADTAITEQFAKLNWASYVLGVCIIGLEFGYINIYRVGWKISVATVVANIGLAVALLIVGYLLYKESISPKQIAGIILCAAGLVLVTKP